jgi:hypothetical protein
MYGRCTFKIKIDLTLPSFSLSLEEEEEKKSLEKEQQKSCGRVYRIHAWLNYLAFFFFPSLSFFCITQEWRGLGWVVVRHFGLFFFLLFCFLHLKIDFHLENINLDEKVKPN